jgi:hypothetical protein
MKTHNWSVHVAGRTSGPAHAAPRQPSAGTVRAWAVRGILALALVPAGFGAVAAATSSGHGSAGHARAPQPAGSHAHGAGASTASLGPSKMPWMY